MTFEHLNNLTREYPAIDYNDYFAVMDIPQEDRDKRIELAENIQGVFDWLFALVVLLAVTEQVIDTEYLVYSVEMRLKDLVNVNVRYVSEHIVRLAGETVEATVTHLDEAYFLSPQRSSEIAADEAHTYYTYDELQEAIESGCTHKVWHTQLDRRVRRTHRVMEGKTIPIEDMFIVNGYEMAVPKDTENSAPLEEIAGCRCWATYS